MKGNIAIIAALSGELKPLVTHRTARSWKRLRSSAGTELWEYRHKDGCWLAVCAGMGASRAAVAFAEAEKAMALDAVCSVGWAGSLRDQIRVGSVLSPALIVDAGTGEQFRPAHWTPEQPTLVSTSDVANAMEKERLAANYDAGLVDMEAATVARIARGKSIPFYCFKAISDDVNAKLADMSPFIADSGQLRLGAFLLHVAVRPYLWKGLIDLGRSSSVAARALADDIYEWIDERGYIRKSVGDYTGDKQR
jgi:adenosylhomocysteine nucleosidase